jgi:2,3-dihydroxyphenylpropionate 1,2-dioxygenase
MKDATPEVEARLIDNRIQTTEQRRARQDRVIQATKLMMQGAGPCRPLNESWDRDLLDVFANQDLDRVAGFTEDWIREQGGNGGQEIRTWIAAFAALNEAGQYSTDLHYYRPIPEWNAGMAMLTAAPASR